MSWFSEGYEKVREYGQRLEDQLNQPFLPTFRLKEGEEATVRFITETPFNFYEHFVKGLKRSFTCSQKADCPLCATGNKPSFKGAYLIVDMREDQWQDKNTGEWKSSKNTLKVMKHGIRALQSIDRKHNKKGLLNYDWVITRTGQGNNTQYDFEDIERVEGIPMPNEEDIPKLSEVLKPKDRSWLISQLAQAGHGQPADPLKVDDDDEGVIRFQE